MLKTSNSCCCGPQLAHNRLHQLLGGYVTLHNSFILKVARSESRTRTPLRARDFKSLVSTIPPSEQKEKKRINATDSGTLDARKNPLPDMAGGKELTSKGKVVGEATA